MTTSSDLLPIMIVADRSVRAAVEADAAVIVFDLALETVLYANAAGRSILGLSPAQAFGEASPVSAVMRQIRSAQRSLAGLGKARILLRGALRTNSKALVADLSVIETQDATRLALVTVADRPASFTAAGLLADTGLGDRAAAIFRSGQNLVATDALDQSALDGLAAAVAGFEASADDVNVEDDGNRRTTLARGPFGHIVALVEESRRPAAAAEPIADVGVPASAIGDPDAIAIEPEGAPAAGFSSFSVKRSKLPRGRASMSMSALVERWHSRRPLDEAAPPSGPETAPQIAAVPDAGAQMQASKEAAPAAEETDTAQSLAQSPVSRRSAWSPVPAESEAADEAPSHEREPEASEEFETCAAGASPAEDAIDEVGESSGLEALASGNGPEGGLQDIASPAAVPSAETARPLRSIWSAPGPSSSSISAEATRPHIIEAPDTSAAAADADLGWSDAGLEDGVREESAEPAADLVILAADEAEPVDAMPPSEPHAAFAFADQDAGLDGEPSTQEAGAVSEFVVLSAADAALTMAPGQPEDAQDAFAPEEDPIESAHAMGDVEAPTGVPDGDVGSDASDMSIEPVEAEEHSAPLPDDEAFVPRFDVAPVRFVWQIDRVGHFRFLSPDFAGAVGPKAAAVLGRSFKDIAQVFGFDDNGEIQRLLDRRDTWSGRSILWPVEASDRKAPVDLAALPVYARDRSFDGFRGFGIVRMNEAVLDETALGLVLAGRPAVLDTPPAHEAVPVPAVVVVGEILAPGPSPAGKALFKTFEAELPGVAFGRRQEPPQPSGEHGANSDDESEPKVIRLEERRRPKDGTLSQAEEAAFRAIGMKLGNDVRSEATALLPIAEAPTPAAPIVDAPVDRLDVEPDAGATIEAAPFEAPAEAWHEPASDLAPLDETSAMETSGDAEPESSHDIQALEEIVDDVPPVETADAAGEVEASLPVAETDAGSKVLLVQPPLMDLDESDASDDDGLQALREDVTDAAMSEGAGEPADPTGDPEGGAEADPVSELDGDTPVEVDAIFASLPLPILVQAGRSLVYANREFEDLSGYASVEALESAGGLGTLFVDRGSEPSAGETTVRRSNGQLLDVRAHMQSVTLAGRSFLLMSFSPSPRDSAAAILAPGGEAMASDADDLRSQIDELQAVLDTATDGVVLLDPSGTIRSMNGSAHALFGIGQAESAGRHLSTLFAHESQKATLDYIEMLRDEGIGGILNDGREVIGRVAQGGFIPLFITIGRLSGERGWCVVIRDIAHWKRIEEDLVNARRQAEAASLHKSRFLANISHELRTPLNAIIGFADVMASECFGPINNARYLEYLGDIKRSGHHVLDLVNDLLDISKIEAGKLDLSFEAVSLNEVVSEVVSLMQPQANRERVIVRSNLPSSVPPVVADRRTMRQIALNLVANAIRFTPAGGQIIASTTYTAEGDVLMRFRDSGIGMTEREIEIALTPFQQVHAPSATRGEGTGLGLPLTKAMVEANRAYFAIQSTPGEGTLVEIAFPSQRVLAD